MSERADVVVIGGGVAGLGVAWRLARRGRDVVLLERDRPGGAATHAAAGMLTPIAEAGHHDDFFALSLRALEAWPAFADELRATSAIDVDLRRDGRLRVALDDGEIEQFEAVACGPAGRACDARVLDGGEARRREPALSAAVRGALFTPHDGSVDSRRVGRALWLAAARAGVRIRTGQHARAIERSGDGAVRGVACDDGARIESSKVVLAAGAWAAEIEGLPAALPVRPVRGEMFAVRDVAAPLRSIVWSGDCYLVPRSDSRVLVGATTDEVGFTPGPTPAGLAQLAHAAGRAVPALATSDILESWAGYRPAAADGLPILGPDPEAPGLVHAAGLFRNGILLAPLVADLIADCADGVSPDAALAPFHVGRFRDA